LLDVFFIHLAAGIQLHYDNTGKLQMQYTFGGLLRAISKVVLTPEQMNLYDYINWHDDELKIVKSNFMLGKWYSPWRQIPLTSGPSFLSVEKNSEDSSRFYLRFTLRCKLQRAMI
jgi:hypothetical protein